MLATTGSKPGPWFWHRVLVIGVLLFIGASTMAAQIADYNVLRIGTGGSGGAYHPIGSLIARQLNRDESLLAVSQRSKGSVANLHDIKDGLVEAALAQADIVHYAYHGDQIFENNPNSHLRSIATLYHESLHFIVRAGSGISGLNDLAGKRVSTDEIGSGTQVIVQHVMRSQHLELDDVTWVYLKPVDAIERLKRGQLDAFLFVAGFPFNGIAELIESGVGEFVPVELPDDQQVLEDFKFITKTLIPPQAYGIVEAVATLGVPAQLVVGAELHADLVYKLTETLWSKETLQLLKAEHPSGGEVDFSSALQGLSAPLHAGAELYYKQHAHPKYKGQ